jgi:hypothetical protein
MGGRVNVAAVMDALGVRLEEIGGLRVYPYSADRVTPPAAIVGWPEPITYDGTLARGLDSMTFPVWIVVGRVDARSARDTLAAYLDGSGTSSVKAALDGGTYTACDSVRVSTAHVESVSIAGTDYLAAILDVEVIGQGGA